MTKEKRRDDVILMTQSWRKPSMKLNKFLLLSLFMPTISFAMFCPTNFNLIDIGDTIEKVDQACGPPDSKETKETDKNVPQEWSYYIPQTVGTGTSYQQEGTLKTTITFDDKGKAINISVNGIGVGASTICGKSIQLGDTRESIQATC